MTLSAIIEADIIAHAERIAQAMRNYRMEWYRKIYDELVDKKHDD